MAVTGSLRNLFVGNVNGSVTPKAGDAAAGTPDASRIASGTWSKDAYATPEALAEYQASLGGKDWSQYDKNRFLEQLGFTQPPLTAGRTDRELFRAFRVSDFKPDETHLPSPQWLTRHGQKGINRLAKLSPASAAKVSQAISKVSVKDSRNTTLPLWGERLTGPSVSIPATARYQGVVTRVHDEQRQHAFMADIHEGSIAREGPKSFGTYDIAKRFGFSEQQAKRIARQVYNVDTDETGYVDANGKARKTHGAQGLDLHWHYNRAKDGEEDTRLTAAKIHLDRAVEHAAKGEFDTAELELGVGLHSIQDLFSHGQITPITHVTLGEFPDTLAWTPVAAYESMLATEGYLSLYLERINVDLEVPYSPPPNPGAASVAPELKPFWDELPAGVRQVLEDEGVQMVVATAAQPPTSLGFGIDLNADGQVGPTTSKDVDQDGVLSNHENEGRRFDGAQWNAVPGGYDAARRLLFVQESALSSGQGRDVFRHEVAHALIHDLLSQPQGKAGVEATWKRARGAGEIPNGGPAAQEYVTDRLSRLDLLDWPTALERLRSGNEL